MNNKGITLVALVVTVIILLILAGVTVAALTGDNGLIKNAGDAKIESEKSAIRETIEVECIAIEGNRSLRGKTDKEKLEVLAEKLKTKNGLEEENSNYLISSKFITITTKQGFIFTVLYDSTIIEGKLAYLDIAEGTIELKENSYKQGENEYEYKGKYIITGTTTENIVKITQKGTYDITIKDLNIDVKNSNYCAINASGKSIETYVTITLEGNNYLQSGYGPGLGFAGAKANINGITNGSTLTIEGNGNLEAKGLGNGYAASGIGSSYGGDARGAVNNITINSGNITAIGKGNASGIGSVLYGNTNNIVINGGNVYAKAGNGSGIGSRGGTVDNIIINGGNITAIAGDYGAGIGGTNSGSGKIQINGGIIKAQGIYQFSAIGGRCKAVQINGGTIKAISTRNEGISCDTEGSIMITGGNVLAKGKNFNIATLEEETSNLVKYIPTNGTNDLYVTPIKLSNAVGNEKIEEVTTSDNINYVISDMFTLEDDTTTSNIDETGMVYLYLPKGIRKINIKANGKTYSGTIETTEIESINTLN